MLSTPVLFCTFARPECARQSFNAIKAAKPSVLYFYSNKAREEKPDEVKRNTEIREYIKEIDWDCDLHTWFRDEYVDVYTSLLGAINWVFDNEEQAIVMEEDAVGSLAFFDFCEKMLNKYKDDLRIWSICGSNYLTKKVKNEYDYYFSHYSYITGWASWRNRWKEIDWNNIKAREVSEAKVMEATFCSRKEQRRYSKYMKRSVEHFERTKCWDGIFNYTGRSQGGLFIIPAKHLVKNVGTTGSHNKIYFKNIAFRDVNYSEKTYQINKIPPFMVVDIEFENKLYNYEKWQESILRRTIDRLFWLIFVKFLKHKPQQQ